jgi:hypothetical protein
LKTIIQDGPYNLTPVRTASCDHLADNLIDYSAPRPRHRRPDMSRHLGRHDRRNCHWLDRRNAVGAVVDLHHTSSLQCTRSKSDFRSDEKTAFAPFIEIAEITERKPHDIC